MNLKSESSPSSSSHPSESPASPQSSPPRLQDILKSAWELEFLTPFKHLNALQTFARIFALVTSIYYVFRLWDWNLLFAKTSFVPMNFITDTFPESVRPWFYFFPESQAVALSLYLLMTLLMVVSVWKPLPVVIKLVVWALHLMFFYRNLPAIYGGDLILNALFLYYLFSEVKNKNIYNWLLFAAKVQVIVVYFVSGLSKLAGRTWIEGSAVGLVMQNEQMMLFTVDVLSVLPLLSALLSWWVVFFELGAPFGFIVPKTKTYWIWTGIGMHLFIAVTMGLWFFSAKMLMGYVFFRPESRT